MNSTTANRSERQSADLLSGGLHSEKIRSWHRERLAVVYVRQSTAQQVLNHQESTRLQYGLKARVQHLGWAEDRVLVVDDDLALSATTAEGRAGFQRLVSEVSLNHVGIIVGIEVSRLARCCKDWHQLLEICALFGTLIVDLDGVYDPAQYNDRLLLGLKGTISEAELHIIKQRMSQGKLNKARRGELGFTLPTGYVRRSSGEAALDPDEPVQQVVRLIFRKFEELGTLNAVLHYLVKHDVQVGVRVRERLGKGELEWHRPNRMTLQNLLKNPISAGAYAYGRRQIDPRHKRPGRPFTGRIVTDPADWLVLMKDRLPAYISWEQYEANLARLKANRARSDELGAVRNGPSRLAGLLVCGKCGHRMTVNYGGGQSRHTYVCSRMATDYGEAFCQAIAGPALDEFVSRQVFVALQPAVLELSLEAGKNLEQERADLTRLWQQRRERVAYEAERAGRHCRLVEPENRLVARQLEREWEEKLAAQKRIEEEYDRLQRKQPRLLTPEEREGIRQLAQNIPALWAAATTTDGERKEIIRQIIERVIVVARGESELVDVAVEWAGGMQTDGEMVRPVGRLDQLSYYAQLCDRIRALAGEKLSAEEIANRLNEAGFRPPKRRLCFGRQGVRDLLGRLGLTRQQSHTQKRDELGKDEWWLPELAREIGMPSMTLHRWIGRGWVTARQQSQPPRRWIILADRLEVERLRERHQRPNGYYTRRIWVAES